MGVDRGNDATATRDRQYGEFETAEDLIKAQDGAFDVEMDKALNKPVDPEATKALDVDAIEPQNDDGVIMSAAVRGGRLIVVEETQGKLVKWSQPHDGASAARSASRQAAAGVGAGGGAGVPSTSGQTNEQQQGQGDGSEGDKAPESVTVPKIKEKLAELSIDEGSATRKDDLWALVPPDAREALVEAAAAS